MSDTWSNVWPDREAVTVIVPRGVAAQLKRAMPAVAPGVYLLDHFILAAPGTALAEHAEETPDETAPDTVSEPVAGDERGAARPTRRQPDRVGRGAGTRPAGRPVPPARRVPDQPREAQTRLPRQADREEARRPRQAEEFQGRDAVVQSPALRTRVAPPKVPVKPGEKLLEPPSADAQGTSWRNSKGKAAQVGRQNRKTPGEITEADLKKVDEMIARGKVTKCAPAHAAGSHAGWSERLF